jgi:uncharacterized repeat protein (TIGR03803 family)
MKPTPTQIRCINRLAKATLLCVALGLTPGVLRGQAIEQVLKSFGYRDGVSPYGRVIQGTDGALYGTTESGGTNNLGMVFRLSTDGTGYTPLYCFTGAGGDGYAPFAGLVQGTDGALYGTTYWGGTNGYGTVFKLSTDGSNYTPLYSFTGAGGDGRYPRAGLVQGTDGALYGTTQSGGEWGDGLVYKLGTNGTGYTRLHSFCSAALDGASPYAGLLQGTDGALYGTTRSGGTNGYGIVFKLGSDGNAYTPLHSFTGADGDGASPSAGLVQGRDGALYGTTYSGGTNGYGMVFKLSTEGSSYTPLYSLTAASGYGANPYTDLIQGSDGVLYGTCFYNGSNNCGMVFKLSTNGAGYTPLHSFAGWDGQNPQAALVQGSDGALYGTTYNGGTDASGVVFKLSTNGAGHTLLYSFTGANGDGARPYAGLIQGGDGALYGTTGWGWTNGCGMVFRLSTNGTGYTPLYKFTGIGGDGAHPYAALIQGRDGALYSTTRNGGTNGYGMVFKLSADGSSYTPLYSFTGLGGDGKNPYGALVQGRDGALYGTTYSGGSNGYGMVFTLGTNGAGYTPLYSFTGSGGDGKNPYAGLVQGGDGALYGTTYNGGTSGYGMVFKLSTTGAGYTRLYSFTGANGDGKNPYAGLAQGSDGTLYGTTYNGGTNGYGMVFKLGTNGAGYAPLYSFTGASGDGKNPYAGLLQGRDGALYGTTYSGGAKAYGIVFRLSTNGTTCTRLYSFTGAGGDGANAYAGLVQGTDGALYGTTYNGGFVGWGTVFRLLVPPFNVELGWLPDRNVWLSTLSVPNVTLRFLASTNLVDWAALTNITGVAGAAQCNDLAATNYTRRFYRAGWIQ